MKAKVLGLFSILPLVMLSLMFFMPSNSVYASSADIVNSQYLIDDGVPYESNIVSGTTSGYGTFPLGSEGIELTANANNGFKLVGWYITYNDFDETNPEASLSSGPTQYIDASGLVDGVKTQTLGEGKTSITYTLKFVDNDSNGDYESGTFAISRVFENISVSPVFDYVYYNIDITDNVSILNLGESVSTSYGTLYYSRLEDGHYSNAILNSGDSYFYYGDVYAEGDSYYTIHEKALDTPTEQHVDLSEGAFRAGQRLDIEFSIADGQKIDVNSVKIDETGMALTLTEPSDSNPLAVDNYYLNRDEFNLVTSITLSHEIEIVNTHVSTLTIEYAQIYQASIKITIDEEDATTDETSLILPSIELVNTYSVIDASSGTYYVKSAEDNNGTAPRVSAPQRVSRTIEIDDTPQTFYYYSFNSINGVEDTVYSFSSSFTGDFEIVIDFSEYEYSVSFNFAVYDSVNNELINMGDAGYNLESGITLSRGESETFSKTDASNNIGYEFRGFSFINYERYIEGTVDKNIDSIDVYVTASNLDTILIYKNSIDVAMPEDTPDDIVILMIYEKINYTVTISNFDKISLINGDETIYPISNINYTRSRDGEILSANINSESLRDGGGSLVFSNTFNIDDVLNLSVSTNNGFVLDGFRLGDSLDYYSTDSTFTIEFNSLFISTAGNIDINNNITINIDEDYELYSYSFYIEAEHDEVLDKNVIMADLSIQYAENTYSTTDISNLPTNVEITVDEDIEARITISGLHLYDELVLSAVGKQREGAESDYYRFVRMTEDDRTNYTPDSYDLTTVTYTARLSKADTQVKVIFSMPNATLLIYADTPDAYDFNKLAVFSRDAEGIETELYPAGSEEENTNILLNVEVGSTIRIKLNRSGETVSDVFAFGYTLHGYTVSTNSYNRTFIDPNSLYDALEYSYTVNSTNGTQFVINIAQIEYRVTVQQFLDNGTEIGYVGFDNDGEILNYKVLTISNGLIEFVMGDYIDTNTDSIASAFVAGSHYAGNVYFINNGEHKYTDMEQTNEYSSAFFSYEISRDELITLAEIYPRIDGENIYFDIKIVYSIHTYNITVEYGISNSDSESLLSRIVFPTIELNYDSITVTANRLDNTLTFSNIPYGVRPTLTATNNIPSGMSADGYYIYENDIESRPNRTDFNRDTSELTFLIGIEKDYTFHYKLSLNTYNINIVITVDGDVVTSGSEIYGTPIVYVNNAVRNQISIYDNLYIDMNAQSGYKFANMTYYKSVLNSENNPETVRVDYSCFVPYSYDESNWNRNYLLLYTIDSETGEYVRNTSVEYNPDLTYYVSTISYYEDSSFNVGNYYVENNNRITFNIEYTGRDYVVVNTNANSGNTNYEKEDTPDLQISPEQYSSFRMFVPSATGSWTEIALTDTIPSNTQRIRIEIRMNDTPTEIDGYTYDLSLGLRLAVIYMFGEANTTFVEEQTGLYSFTFNFANIRDRITNGILDINYYYQAEDRYITLTTNVGSESFYYRNGQSQFTVYYDSSSYGYGSSYRNNEESNPTAVTNLMYYLAKAEFGFTNRHNNFEVNGIRAYLAKTKASGELDLDENGNIQRGEEIPVSQYAYYGITLNTPMGTSFGLRFISNMIIELQVQPIIRLHGDENHTFTSIFICDNFGVGQAQTLTVGANENYNIEIDDIIADYLVIRYYDENGYESTAPTNVGRYKVEFSLVNTSGDSSYDWMNSIRFLTDVYFVIDAKNVSVSYSSNLSFNKTYDGSFMYNTDNLLNYLVITDGAQLNISLNSETDFILNQDMLAYITYTLNGEQIATASANEEGALYNIYITGLSLYNDTFNNNFALTSDTLIINNVLRILKKELTLNGVTAMDKVFDGTTDVEISTDANLSLVGLIDGDRVDSPTADKLSLAFENEEVGRNKRVIVDVSQLLTGEDAGNYKINNSSVRASIYPYSISYTIDGIGTFSVFNEIGLTDPTQADLIPINASLRVEIISTESVEYANLYPSIASYLVNNRVVVYGLRLRLVVNNVERTIDSNLMLAIPNVERFLGAIYVSGEQVGEVGSTQSDGNIVIRLSDIGYNLDRLMLTQQRQLFAIWQIVLIILLVLLLIAVIVVVIIVSRKRKREMYDRMDKI